MVVTLREVLANLAQLLFDDVVIVDEPFGGGRDGAAVANRFDECFVNSFEPTSVVFETRQKLGAALFGDGLVFGGECLSVLLETFDTEDLSLKRLFVIFGLLLAER